MTFQKLFLGNNFWWIFWKKLMICVKKYFVKWLCCSIFYIIFQIFSSRYFSKYIHQWLNQKHYSSESFVSKVLHWNHLRKSRLRAIKVNHSWPGYIQTYLLFLINFPKISKTFRLKKRLKMVKNQMLAQLKIKWIIRNMSSGRNIFRPIRSYF